MIVCGEEQREERAEEATCAAYEHRRYEEQHVQIDRIVNIKFDRSTRSPSLQLT